MQFQKWSFFFAERQPSGIAGGHRLNLRKSMTDQNQTSKVSNPGDSLHGIVRQVFEAWISGPPYERETERWPQDETLYAWPGQYKDITVEVAWDAWQESGRETPALRDRIKGLEYVIKQNAVIIPPNVPSHRIPPAFGTTSCARKNRDESAEGTGFGGLAR